MSRPLFHGSASRRTSFALLTVLAVLAACGAVGCRSPYYGDRLAGAGGLAGAGIGAGIGAAAGDPISGALIGAAAGAITGGVVGDAMDEQAARTAALIEQQTGQRMQGAVTIPQVAAMARGGVSEEVIAAHIQANGVAAPLTPQDLIYLKQQGVSDGIVQAMQLPRPVYGAAPAMHAVPVPVGPVIVPHPYYAPSWHAHRHCPPPRVSWGVSVHGH